MELWDVAILVGGLWASVMVWAGISGWLEERDRKALKKWQERKKKDKAQLDWIDELG